MIVDALIAITAAAGYFIPSKLGEWHRDNVADCAVFSYKRDFAMLWGLAERGLDEIARSLIDSRDTKDYTLIVVWDGVPDTETVGVSRYVTPYEWAAALSLSIYGKNASKLRGPKLRFLMLNLPSAPRDGFMQHNLFAFHNVLPWIQGYEVCAENDIGIAEIALLDLNNSTDVAFMRQAVLPTRQQLEHLLNDLREPQRVATTFTDDDDPEVRWRYLRTLREVWRQEFLKPGDRHAVANLVGPLLLASGWEEGIRRRYLELIEGDSQARLAVKEVLVQVELLKSATTKESTKHEGNGLEQGGGGLFGRREGVRFLLVDDEFALGYHHALAFALFNKDYDPQLAKSKKGGVWQYGKTLAQLRCIDSPDSLFLALEGLGKINDWLQPRTLDLEHCDVLLLDLRLWHNDRGQRKIFLKKLIRICEALGADRIKDKAFESALRAAHQMLNDTGSNEIPALPLLALLISHCDPSLPIILFSSTHQRDVVEMVAHRSNIITTFSKPLLMGYDEAQQPGLHVDHLFAALRRAMDLHEARIVWDRIATIEWGGSPPVFRMAFKRNGVETEQIFADGTNGTLRHDPRLQGSDLRCALAALYRHYILGANYFDFSSAPFEFLERVLSPENDFLRRHGVPADADFRWFRDTPRNRIGNALKGIRNAKVHGDVARPENESLTNWWLTISIVEFLALLDYIEEATFAFEHSQVQYVKSLTRVQPPANRDWRAFVTYHIGKCIGDSYSETERTDVMASRSTCEAIVRLLEQRKS